MNTISQNEALANLPISELEAAIEHFLQPVTDRLPDKRLGRVAYCDPDGSWSDSREQNDLGDGQVLLSLVSQSAYPTSGLAQRPLCARPATGGTGSTCVCDRGTRPGQLREALLSTGRRCLHRDEKHATSFGWQETLDQGRVAR